MPTSFWAKHFGFPDKDRDPMKWNQGCEKLMSLELIGSRQEILSSLECMSEQDLQPYYVCHRDRVAYLCILQQALTKEASACFAIRDLEKQWLEASVSTRRSHILEGLVRACCTPDYERDRLSCPELTLDGLEAGNGQTFLSMLQFCMLEDASSSPSAPRLLTSKWTFTPSASSPDNWREEVGHASYVLSRTVFIYQFLLCTLGSCCQVPRPTSSVKQGKGPTPYRVHKGIDKRLESKLGRDVLRALHREEKALHKEFVMLCERCGRHEDKSVKFMVCKSCKENVDRRVFYCSAECQRADWKPRHKVICGKLLTLADAISSAIPATTPDLHSSSDEPASTIERIGPTLDNYKRSPALVYQIYSIHNEPGLDYVFFTPSGDDYPFVIQDPETKVVFRQCREEAMTTGNAFAIAKLCEFLCYMMSKSTTGLTRQDVMKQLSNEYAYGCDVSVVSDVVVAFDKIRAKDRRGRTTLERERDGLVNHIS